MVLQIILAFAEIFSPKRNCFQNCVRLYHEPTIGGIDSRNKQEIYIVTQSL